MVAVHKVQNRTQTKLVYDLVTLLSLSSKSEINIPRFTHLKAKQLLVHDGYYLRIYHLRSRIQN